MSANRKLFLFAVSSEFESCRKLLAGDLKRPTLDVHLHRTRLVASLPEDARKKSFPDVDPKAELARARELLEKHGYGRRREELADAEAAAARWS